MRGKEEIREYLRGYREANREELAAKDAIRNAIYYAKNKEKLLQQKRNHYVGNEEKRRAIDTKWRKKNLSRVNEKTRRYMADKLKATPGWATRESLLCFYEDARKRSETSGVIHHVDHIVPLRSPVVCGLHCEANLQILPGVENLSKSNRYWPDMPEQN